MTSIISSEPPYQALLQSILVKQKLPPETRPNVVIYTDGGCRPVPNGVGGFGFHGYIYLPIHTKVGHGCKGFTPTAKGHLLHKAGKVDEIKAQAVTVISYFDGLGSLPAPSTNNIAELQAFIHSMELLVNDIKPAEVLFMMDSKYVLTGTQDYLNTWKENKWRLKSGEEVKNKALWQRIDELLVQLAEQGTAVVYGWVKGHSDEVGNIQADLLASSAVNAGLNGRFYYKVKYSQTKGYWGPDTEHHPFLNESKWYYSTGPGYWLNNGWYLYHLGNHNKGDSLNKTLGVRNSDSRFAVVALKSPDRALEELRDFHRDRIRDYGQVVVVGLLDNILKPVYYQQLTEHKTDFMLFSEKNGQLITATKVPLTDELFPARKSMEATRVLTDMEGILRDYVSETLSKDYVLTSIADLIYDKGEATSVPTNKKDESVPKLRIPQGKEFMVLKTSVEYYHSDKDSRLSSELSLTLGLDLPVRNIFLNVADQHPQVYIVTWPECDSPIAFRYASLIVTDTAVGLWASPYANLRILA